MKLLTIIKQATMENLVLYSQYFLKISLKIKAIFSTQVGAVLGFTFASFSVLSTVQQALCLLLALYLGDFATGIGASYVEKRNKKKELKEQEDWESLFKLEQANLITSEKLKLSLIKAFTYASVIISIQFIEIIFKIKSFPFPSFSDVHFSITLIFIGFCCAIEFYSIFFENSKRMGFDIVGHLISTIRGFKKVFSETKKEE